MNKTKLKLLSTKSDSLINLVTNMNTGSDRLQQTFNSPSSFYNYQELAAIHGGWLGRRVTDLPPSEALKKGWGIHCPSWDPEKIFMLNKYTEYLELKKLMLEALKSERCFGGSLILALTDSTWGSMNNPIPDFLPKNTLLRLQMFDAWQAYAAEVNLMNPLRNDYRYPVTYTIGAAGMAMMRGGKKDYLSGTVVSNTRVERFGGEWMPWYERQRNLYWGQSILSSAYEALRNAGIVDNAVASLIFKASVPIMKVKDLVNIVSDDNAKAAFLERMNILNYQISNNNMGVIDDEESLDNLEVGALSGLDTTLERFYVIVSAAAGIVVTKLIGESARGLNATGDGDLNNYYDMIETYQEDKIKPRLMNIYKRWIVPSLFDELLPKDFDIVFPELERETPSKKQEMDTGFLEMVSGAVDNGFIDKEIAQKEIVERGVFKNFTQEDIDRIKKGTEENEVDLNDALDLADETYGIKK